MRKCFEEIFQQFQLVTLVGIIISFLTNSIDGFLTTPTLNRVSKSSDGSLLEDTPGSVDWSSDSLPDELDQSPPPKPPLPLKGILSDFGSVDNVMSCHVLLITIICSYRFYSR